MKTNTKRIVFISILIAFSVVLSGFDNLISYGIFGFIRSIVPGLKLGLANIVILLFIYRLKIYEGVIAAVLKSIISALLFTQITGFMIGFPGTIISFIIMTLLYRTLKSDKSIIFVSAIGAFSHIVGQIASAFIIYGINDVKAALIYSPYMILISVASGIVMGFIAKKTLVLLDHTGIIKEEDK